MPTWDEITPFTERHTLSRRLTVVSVLILLNIVGFVVPALAMAAKVFVAPYVAFTTQAIERLWLWQFFTYTFLHSLTFEGILNLAFGCYFGLWVFGRELEEEMGWKRFLTFYLATGVYGGVAHSIYWAVSQSTLSASSFDGPALAIFLVWALRVPDRRILFFFFIPMRAVTAALLSVGLVLIYCIGYFHMGYSPVALLGAVATGFVLWRLEPRLDALLDARDARLARRRFLDDFETRQQVDAILDKINREGMGGLSAREKWLLKRASSLYGDERGKRHE